MRLCSTLCAIIFFYLTLPTQATQISNIGCITKNDTKQITLNLSKKTTFKTFSLSKPDRLVIDFNQSQWLVKNINYAKLAPCLINKIRTGNPQPNILRVVFDLKIKPEEFFSKLLLKNNNYKLITLIKPIPEINNNIFSVLDTTALTKPTVKTEIFAPLSKKSSTIKKNKSKIKKHIIVIDPGHGGYDPGAIGRYFKTHEKNITLAYAKALYNRLNRNKKYQVYLTRNTDKYLSLPSRRRIARKFKADIFISLHADSNPNRYTRGASVYTLSEKAYDRESQKLSYRENKINLIRKVSLKGEKQDIASMLIDLIRRDTKNVSANFANITTKELGKRVKLLRDSHRFAGFNVLRGVEIPAILIELGQLSNRQEEKILGTTEHKNKIVEALTISIDKHFKIQQNYKFRN